MGVFDILQLDLEYLAKWDAWSEGMNNLNFFEDPELEFADPPEDDDDETFMSILQKMRKKKTEFGDARRSRTASRGSRRVNTSSANAQRQEELKKDRKRKAVTDDLATVPIRRRALPELVPKMRTDSCNEPTRQAPAKTQDSPEASEEAKLDEVKRKLKDSYSEADIKRSFQKIDFRSMTDWKKGTSREGILKKINKRRSSTRPSFMKMTPPV